VCLVRHKACNLSGCLPVSTRHLTASSLVFIAAPAISSAIAPAKSRGVRDVTGHDVVSHVAPPRLRRVNNSTSCGVIRWFLLSSTIAYNTQRKMEFLNRRLRRLSVGDTCEWVRSNHAASRHFSIQFISQVSVYWDVCCFTWISDSVI